MLTRVGDRLRWWPVWAFWALQIPSLSLPPFGIFSSSNQGPCTTGGRGGLEELRGRPAPHHFGAGSPWVWCRERCYPL